MGNKEDWKRSVKEIKAQIGLQHHIRRSLVGLVLDRFPYKNFQESWVDLHQIQCVIKCPRKLGGLCSSLLEKFQRKFGGPSSRSILL